jgi:hypothetical protein
MSGAELQDRAVAPFWPLALALWLLSLCGGLLVLPYVATLESKALAAAAARTHLGVDTLLAISIAQTAVLLAVAVGVGLWAARKLGLGTPLIAALVTRTPMPKKVGRTLLLALVLGIAMGVLLILLDKFVFAPLPSVAELIRNAGTGGVKPGPWQGLLASFYGALDEEILMRLGLVSLLALVFRSLGRMGGGNRDVLLPSWAFWAANIAAAVLFGLGHLPATAALAPLTQALVVRAIVLNGLVGIVCGVLYRRYGLEWAMGSHFGADIVLHVAVG